MSHSTGPPSWFRRRDQALSTIAQLAAALVRSLAGLPDPPPRYHNGRPRSRRRKRRRHQRLLIIHEDLQEETESCHAAPAAPHPPESGPPEFSPPHPTAPVAHPRRRSPS